MPTTFRIPSDPPITITPGLSSWLVTLHRTSHPHNRRVDGSLQDALAVAERWIHATTNQQETQQDAAVRVGSLTYDAIHPKP